MTTMFIRRNAYKLKALLVSTSGLLITACSSWTEPARVEADFGNSVRNMIAEQIYDPEAAQRPDAGVPLGDGISSINGVNGFQQAGSEARVERIEQSGSPIPVVGITSDPDD